MAVKQFASHDDVYCQSCSRHPRPRGAGSTPRGASPRLGRCRRAAAGRRRQRSDLADSRARLLPSAASPTSGHVERLWRADRCLNHPDKRMCGVGGERQIRDDHPDVQLNIRRRLALSSPHGVTASSWSTPSNTTTSSRNRSICLAGAQRSPGCARGSLRGRARYQRRTSRVARLLQT